MTDLSHLPEDVREALTRFTNYVQISIDGKRFASSDADTLRDYILRVTAERDALAKLARKVKVE